MNNPERIRILDAMRGLAVILMTAYHLIYDLVCFAGFPISLLYNPATELLHVSAYIFIFLAGVCCNFSHGNLRRGFITLFFALIITLVTYIIDMPIRFGILHLLGVCMVLYGLFPKFFASLTVLPTTVFCTALFIITDRICDSMIVNSRCLWMFGFKYSGFFSEDYYPLLPWIFLFIAGTVIGKLISGHKFPPKFYELSFPPLEAVGRHAMLIYLLNQPVLYSLVIAGVYIFGA